MSDNIPEQIIQMNQLTLEKLKMDERLRAVENHMAEGNVVRSQIKEMIQSLNDTIGRIDGHLFGKGGLEDRVKNLENESIVRNKRHDSVMKVIIPLVVTGITALIAMIFSALVSVSKFLK